MGPDLLGRLGLAPDEPVLAGAGAGAVVVTLADDTERSSTTLDALLDYLTGRCGTDAANASTARKEK